MQSTQLVCPHCGSNLNFNGAISAGTNVECLICMRPFAATNPKTVTLPPPTAPKAVTAPPKPATAATATAAPPKVAPVSAKPMPVAAAAPPVAEKPAPTPKTAPTIRRPVEEAGTSPLLIGVCVVLLALLSAGLVFTIWKITSSAGGGSSDPNKDQVAVNPPDGPAKDAKAKTNDAKVTPPNDGPAKDASGKDKGDAPKNIKPPVEDKDKKGTKDDDDDDDAIKKKGGQRDTKLERKPDSAKPNTDGNTPKIDPIDPPQPMEVKVPGLDRKQINAAIDRGVLWLRKTQTGEGTWGDTTVLGYAALSGLTLLECGVPAKDPAVQRAANFVRGRLANHTFSYEICCSILFLDRLGDPRDRPIIQGLALRLMAAQKEYGGWAYNVPLLTPDEMYLLLNHLHVNRQPGLLNPLSAPLKKGNIHVGMVREPGKTFDPFNLLNDRIRQNGIPNAKFANGLPSKLKELPVVQNQGRRKSEIRVKPADNSDDCDNSNTQFVLLALWAARRHDVPVDYAILAAYQRLVSGQAGDGTWSYSHRTPGQHVNTMTCVGLLGLAMGHGTAPEFTNPDVKDPRDLLVKPALEDRAIQRGLGFLGKHIGQPAENLAAVNFQVENMYFMWSIERVAMLYDLKTIEGKDWYGWGAQSLVKTQQPAGDWGSGGYPGNSPTINTCFALLFLKRSNLVQDLTNNLRLQSVIRD